MPIKRSDLTGHISGRLTALYPLKTRASDGSVHWHCVCTCGRECFVASPALKQGITKSCGCLRLDVVRDVCRTHGMRQSPEYTVWAGMLDRCRNPKNTKYHARGITVCSRWGLFANFYADMGSKPTQAHSIDRIDNDGPYSPDNCRWATKKEQAMNRRSNVWITLEGVEHSLSECRHLLAYHGPVSSGDSLLGGPFRRLC